MRQFQLGLESSVFLTCLNVKRQSPLRICPKCPQQLYKCFLTIGQLDNSVNKSAINFFWKSTLPFISEFGWGL